MDKIKIIPVILCAFLLPACTDWLSVDPIDSYVEGTVFSNEENIQRALNGIYITMGQNALYGRDFTLGTVEMLGQQYALAGANVDNSALKYSMINYSFSTSTAKSKFLSMWKGAYTTILDINNFIENMGAVGTSVISQNNKDLLLGEAYGLRAYLHLDLLRLFGPVYLTDSTDISIPYRDEAKVEYGPRLAANEVMSKIMNDLDRSIDYLKNDPVIKLGAMAVAVDSLSADQKNIKEFYRYRNRRMNYYAANALKVRALMYSNNKEAAAQLASTLLEASAVPKQFPWALSIDVYKDKSADRIFSTEVLFGVHSNNMYKIYTDYFAMSIVSAFSMYAPMTGNIAELFDSSSSAFYLCNDWRSKNWIKYAADEQYMVSYKLSKSTNETNFWYFQPLIRKAELYYALAESRDDVTYLDSVRVHRNIKRVEELYPTYSLADELDKEFVREMHLEGQIFFYYKRQSRSSIPSGSYVNSKKSMSVSEYVIPIPESEEDK